MKCARKELILNAGRFKIQFHFLFVFFLFKILIPLYLTFSANLATHSSTGKIVLLLRCPQTATLADL